MKKFHKKLIPYLFISPFFIGYAIFFAYPVFQSLNPEDLIHEGNTAPIHEGARKYYLEKGLVKN